METNKLNNMETKTEPVGKIPGIRPMKFVDALKLLNIEDFKDRIWNSNSRGELFYIAEYVILSQRIEAQNPESLSSFRNWFIGVVEYAEKNWERPESVFQHILRIFIDNSIPKR